MTFSEQYLEETQKVLAGIDRMQIEALATGLAQIRDHGGRVFLLGLGGSAAHASHAAADFRKLCGLNTICLTDNVAALTAAGNDDGWEAVFATLLRQHQWGGDDALLILSVGGGSSAVSGSIAHAARLSGFHSDMRRVFAIVGRDGGYSRLRAHVYVLIPPLYPDHVTPHTEGLTSMVLHCLVSHPALQVQPPKWESLA